MAKRIFSLMLALAAVFSMTLVCAAAEPSTVVEYDGSNITYTNARQNDRVRKYASRRPL